MAITLDGRELGIEGCDFEASGETAGDVVEQMVAHLRREHDVDLPNADRILEEDFSASPGLAGPDEAQLLLIERIREALDLVAEKEPPAPEPSIGRTPSR